MAAIHTEWSIKTFKMSFLLLTKWSQQSYTVVSFVLAKKMYKIRICLA